MTDKSAAPRRVVVTGLGAVTPIGLDVNDYWASLKAGRSGISRIENWQRHPGLAELKRDDRRLLAPSFHRLARDARTVANRVDDLWPNPAVDESP